MRGDSLRHAAWRHSWAEGLADHSFDPIRSTNCRKSREQPVRSMRSLTCKPCSRTRIHSGPLLGNLSRVSISKMVMAREKMSALVRSTEGEQLSTSLARYRESPYSTSPERILAALLSPKSAILRVSPCKSMFQGFKSRCRMPQRCRQQSPCKAPLRILLIVRYQKGLRIALCLSIICERLSSQNSITRNRVPSYIHEWKQRMTLGDCQTSAHSAPKAWTQLMDILLARVCLMANSSCERRDWKSATSEKCPAPSPRTNWQSCQSRLKENMLTVVSSRSISTYSPLPFRDQGFSFILELVDSRLRLPVGL